MGTEANGKIGEPRRLLWYLNSRSQNTSNQRCKMCYRHTAIWWKDKICPWAQRPPIHVSKHKVGLEIFRMGGWGGKKKEIVKMKTYGEDPRGGEYNADRWGNFHPGVCLPSTLISKQS